MKKNGYQTAKKRFIDAYKKVRKPTTPSERVIPDKRRQLESREDLQEYKEYKGYKDYGSQEAPAMRARVIITGKVQGVFFRALVQEQAVAAGVTGWVRNRTDGSVEIVLEGDKEAVQQVIDWCYRGPPAARVDGVEIFWEPATGEYESFEARHTF